MAHLGWAQQASPSLAVKLSTDREAIYQHETFVLTVTVVSSGIRLGKGITLDGLPDTDTLLINALEDLPIQRSLEGRSILETRRYRARCRALKPGIIRLAPSVAATRIVQKRMFIGRRWVEAPIRLPVDAIDIPIAAIPPPGPDLRFSGAVGTFTFEAEPKPLDVAVGDLVKMQIRITGDGYLDDVTCPATGPEAGFKVYPPRLIRKDMTGIEFEQALIPLSAAATVIPALSFTSFDARAGEYQTYRQGPYRLTFHAKRAIDRSQQYRPSPPESTREADAASAAALALRVPEKGGAEVVAAHEAAAQAYASGYYEAALEAYAELSEEAPAWLLFNRGIIQLGAGQYGQAIAQLMRSLHAEPRNAETRRALEHACRIAGVTPADWVGDWKERFRRHPRWEHTAIVSDPVAARLAPAGSARGLFDCKPGQVVSVGEQSGTWLSIRRGGNMGWVPAHAVTRLGSAE